MGKPRNQATMPKANCKGAQHPKKKTAITKKYDRDQARDVHSWSLGLQKWSVKVQQAAQLESKHGET
jgi:hypothetical protein